MKSALNKMALDPKACADAADIVTDEIAYAKDLKGCGRVREHVNKARKETALVFRALNTTLDALDKVAQPPSLHPAPPAPYTMPPGVVTAVQKRREKRQAAQQTAPPLTVTWRENEDSPEQRTAPTDPGYTPTSSSYEPDIPSYYPSPPGSPACDSPTSPSWSPCSPVPLRDRTVFEQSLLSMVHSKFVNNGQADACIHKIKKAATEDAMKEWTLTRRRLDEEKRQAAGLTYFFAGDHRAHFNPRFV